MAKLGLKVGWTWFLDFYFVGSWCRDVVFRGWFDGFKTNERTLSSFAGGFIHL